MVTSGNINATPYRINYNNLRMLSQASTGSYGQVAGPNHLLSVFISWKDKHPSQKDMSFTEWTKIVMKLDEEERAWRQTETAALLPPHREC